MKFKVQGSWVEFGWNRAHHYSHPYHLSLLLCVVGRGDSCEKDQVACSADTVYYLVLYRKHLVTPGLDRFSSKSL